MMKPGKRGPYKTHCVNGHLRTKKNLSGFHCRRCDSIRHKSKRDFAKLSRGESLVRMSPRRPACACGHGARFHDDGAECYHATAGVLDCSCVRYEVERVKVAA